MYLENILKIINAWDPVGLLNLHSPNDEYADEVEKIRKICDTNISCCELGKKIQEIFIQSFGNDVFINSTKECIDIAKKIKNIIQQ